VSDTALRVSPKALLDGVVRALQEQVLPHVDSRTARGQLWAAIDVLRNLAGRVEISTAAFEEEARSAEGALGALAREAHATGAGPLAAAIDAALATAPPAPAPARVAALREILRDAFARLDTLPAAQADALRPLLGGHLAAQAVRDVLRLQGSLLEEISRG
jgi:hypothetical protein